MYSPLYHALHLRRYISLSNSGAFIMFSCNRMSLELIYGSILHSAIFFNYWQ